MPKDSLYLFNYVTVRNASVSTYYPVCNLPQIIHFVDVKFLSIIDVSMS